MKPVVDRWLTPANHTAVPTFRLLGSRCDTPHKISGSHEDSRINFQRGKVAENLVRCRIITNPILVLYDL